MKALGVGHVALAGVAPEWCNADGVKRSQSIGCLSLTGSRLCLTGMPILRRFSESTGEDKA